MLDLAHIPLIDGHCHPIPETYPDVASVEDLARTMHLGAMGDRGFPGAQATQTVFFKRLVLELARHFGCRPEPEAVFRCHQARRGNYGAYIRELMAASNLETLLVDTGYPANGIPLAGFARTVPEVTIREIVRIEAVSERLLQQRLSFSEFLTGFRDALVTRASRDGAVAFKSVIAYRTGLEVDLVDREEAEREYRRCLIGKDDARKVIHDFLFREAADICLDLDLPFQVHTGVGARRIRLHLAQPGKLCRFLLHGPYRRLKLVLVHGGYPYVEEAAAMTNLFPHVYADLSEWVPLVHTGAARKLLDLLALAPLTRVTYGSDGFNVPEVYWMAAILGRESLARALDVLMTQGAVTRRQAEAAARLILAENARTLYRL